MSDPSAEPQAPPPAEQSASEGGAPAPPEQDIDPMRAMRANLGIPERRGGTPIHSNLDVTLRRLGWGMLALGTACLVLWRVLSWVHA